MRWIRTGLVCVGILLAVMAILVVLLFTMDLGRFKPQVESLASSQLGRRLQIQGPLHASVGKQIHLVAEAIRLENPDWASNDSLLRAQRLDVSLNTLALISGRILIENINLDDIAIHLEQNDAGLNNWTLFESEPTTVADDSGPGLDLLIRQARVRNLTVIYIEPAQSSPIRFHAAAIDQAELPSGDLQLELDGNINGTLVTLNGMAGSFANLIAAGEVHYDLRAVIGEISINSNAQIDNLAEPRKPVGRFEVSGPNAEYLTDIFGIAPVTRGPLNLFATIEPVADKMNLTIQGAFGEFEIDVIGSFSDLQNLDAIDIDFSAGGPNAATFGELSGLEHIPEDPYSIRGRIRGKGDAITVENVAIEIGETEFDLNATIAEFPGIDGAVVSLAFKGPDFGRFNKLLGLPGKLTGPFSLTADLSQSPEGSELIDITAKTTDIQFRVDGVVSTEPNFIGTELALSAQGDDLSVMAAALDIPNGPRVPFDVSANVARSDRGFAIDEGIANLGDDVMRVAGLVGIEPLESDTDIKFQISGPDLSGTLAILEIDTNNISDDRYQASGRVYRRDDSFVLEQVVATLGKAEDYQVRLDGKVTDAPEFIGTRVKVSAKGASLQEVAAIAGVSGLPAAAFQISANVDRREEGFAISDGEARLADDQILVTGLVGNQPLERDTDLRFQVSGPDLGRTLNMAGVEIANLPPGSYEAAGRIRRKTGYFDLDDITARLGDTRAELGGRLGELTDFEGTDIDLKIEGDSLGGLVPETGGDFSLADVPFDLAANIRIADDALNIRDLAVQIGAGELSSNVSVNMSPMFASGRVDIEANGPDVAEWLPNFSDYVPASAPFDLDVAVRWQDTHVTIDQLSLQLAKGRLVADGEVDVVTDLAQTNLTVDLQVASMSNLGRVAGTPLPDEPLTLSAQLVGSTEAIRLDDLRLMAGKSDLSGSAVYDIGGEIPRVEVNLTSAFMNLTPFVPEPDDTAKGDAASSQTAPQEDDSRVIPDTPIPMDLLNQLDARVDISVGELVLRDIRLLDLMVDGSLQDGALRIDKFELAGELGGVLGGQLEVLPAPEGAAISTTIDGTNMTLGLTPSGPDAIDKLPSYDVQVKLAGRGATVRDMAASLDGTVRLVGGSGQIKGVPGWFARDLTAEVADKVNPFTKKEGYARIQCSAILLRSIDGKIDGVPALVLQTDKLNIISVAYVDLATEKIDIKFETAARKGIGVGVADFITPYTKISGTMAKPSLVFDTEEAVKRGAQTAATLGTSWIAKKVKNRFFSPNDPCGKEVLKADEEMRQLGGE